MRIVFFSKATQSAGSSRHRAFFWADTLRAAGYDAEVIPPPAHNPTVTRQYARMRYVHAALSARHGDVIILQSTFFPMMFILCIWVTRILFRPTIVLDFDDAMWITTPYKLRLLIHLADRVIVASHGLAQWPGLAKKDVLVMPNLAKATPPTNANPSSHTANTKVILGWIGNASESIENLALLKPVCALLAKRKVSCIVRIIGTKDDPRIDELFSETGIVFEKIPSLDWTREGEIQKANAGFDIGLCPLAATEINEMRCSLKVIDYMAAGIPIVASSVGENKVFIQDGVTGFLPTTPEAWADHIEKLVQDTEMRTNMGHASRKRFEDTYTYTARLKEYVVFLGVF